MYNFRLEFELSSTFQYENSILELLNKHGISATFFTTANFAKNYPKLVKDISKKHEIACQILYNYQG